MAAKVSVSVAVVLPQLPLPSPFPLVVEHNAFGVCGVFLTTTVVVCDLFTNRPFTLNRRSARFFRQLYRIFLFHTRRVRLLWNLAMMAALSAGV